MATRGGVAYANTPDEGVFTDSQQMAIVDKYWDELQPSEDPWASFKSRAETLAATIEAPSPVLTKYLDIAEELRSDGAGRVVTLLPSRVDAVPVGLAKLSEVKEKAARFVMPFLAGTQLGAAFKVLDLTFKGASWLAATVFPGKTREYLNPRVVPTREAIADKWVSPRGRTAEGLCHNTSLGQLFISRDTVTDEQTGFTGHVIGIRRPDDPSSTTRMYIVRLLA